MLKNNYQEEFLNIINPIITHEEFLKRKEFMHHGKTTVFDHSMKVAYRAYKIAKKLKLNYKDAAIAGILHDFYYKPWQSLDRNTPLLKKHGFVHGNEASINSLKYFPSLVNDEILDAIKKHMFPLTITPPKYKLGWVLTLADKIESMEVIFHPSILLSFFKKTD